MNLPSCPVCGKGVLLPLEGQGVWVCHMPDCAYAVGMDTSYSKGAAAKKEVRKDDKHYVHFDF